MPQKIIDLRKRKEVAAVRRSAAFLRPRAVSAPAFPAHAPRVAAPEIKPSTPIQPAPQTAAKPVEKSATESPAPAKEYFAPMLAWTAEKNAMSEEERRGRNIIIVGGAFLIALVSVFAGNYLLALFIALAAFVLYAGAGRKSNAVKCAITPRGIKIENRVYEFSDLKSFWIFYEPPETKELSLESKKTMMPIIRAPLGDTDPMKLREMLLRFIPEKKHEESLTDIIGRKFLE
jgi:hypothetical protein